MEKNCRQELTQIFVLIVSLLSCTVLWSHQDYKASSLVTALTVIDQTYVDSVDGDRLFEEAVKGMLNALDPYSEYLNAAAYQELQKETSGFFAGIGVDLVKKDHFLVLIAPMIGSPADLMGLKAGDKIIRIDGRSLYDLSLDVAVSLIRGVPGSHVNVTVLRKGEELSFSVLRRVIQVKALQDMTIIDGDVGYLKVTQFQTKILSNLRKVLFRLKEAGAKQLILDLRNNSGGILQSGVDVCGLFLRRNKKVLTLYGRQQNEESVYRVKSDPVYAQLPLIILINKGTASTSEVVSGTLQFYKRAIIVGTRSFGKGSVQTLIPLPKKGALRLTTHRYVLPNGEMIEGQGVLPDHIMELSDGNKWYRPKMDRFKRPRKTQGSFSLVKVSSTEIQDEVLLKALDLF
jgi:carboxyl-terminal processing protease